MNRSQLYLLLLLASLAGTAQANDWGSALKKILNSSSTSSDSSASSSSSAPSSSSLPAASLSEPEMVSGLKEALAVGSERAIQALAAPGGYLNDPAVRIPLPPALRHAEKTLRALGQERLIDDFNATMNRAAEAAVPQGATIIGDAIRELSIADAQKLLGGADDAATQYFREKTSTRLAELMHPIVQQATAQTGVTQTWKQVSRHAGPAASLLGDSADLDRYVTDKTLEGLFVKLAEEERAIRQNPVARSTELLKKVFGRFTGR